MKTLFIIGSGGFSKQVIEIVEEMNQQKKEYDLKGLIHDDPKLWGKTLLGYEILGGIAYLQDLAEKEKVYSVVAVGDGDYREGIMKRLSGVYWENLIHPRAIVSKYIDLGQGNIICGGVVVNPMCKIGDHCNINIGSTLGHDVTLESFSTVMPGCNLSGYVHVGKYATLGTGSVIVQELRIGEKSMIGAGAVVVEDVEEKSLYVGVPAKKIRDIH